MSLRILVCGGRDYANDRFLFGALDAVRRSFGIEVIIEGGASGADFLARTWAHANGVEVETYEAPWLYLGTIAGPIRNARMIKLGKPDGVVAFPGGRGTNNMVDQARRAGIIVWDLRKKGEA